jgi:vitamin B12/bleomycin/antimicrobial peptide transport system ATP-binding/permease protein
VTQTQIAYGQVSGALSWFVDAYQEIAAWRANIERLATFAEKLDESRNELARAGIKVVEKPDRAVHLRKVALSDAGGHIIAQDMDADLDAGEHIAVLGPAGGAKTTLFRAMAGIWPFGSGQIELPEHARSLFLPHQPYLPIGSLREAVSYPSPAGTFSDEAIAEALKLIGLEHLVQRLDDAEPWEQQLSIDEQQRLTFARIFLQRPDWIYMDDATGALDEAMEKQVYGILAKHLPDAAVLSITNRPTVAGYNQCQWLLEPGEDGAMRLKQVLSAI